MHLRWKNERVGIAHWFSPNSGANDARDLLHYQMVATTMEITSTWVTSPILDITIHGTVFGYSLHLSHDSPGVSRWGDYQHCGLSVRCVKD